MQSTEDIKAQSLDIINDLVDLKSTFPLDSERISRVHAAATRANELVSSLRDPTEFVDIFIDNVSSNTLDTGAKNVLTFVLRLLLGDRPRPLTALLLFVTVIERFLKDLVKSVGKLSESAVPFLMKDVLGMHVLEEAIGAPLVSLFTILLGPVVSFNLRNVTWHGFAHTEDFGRDAGAYCSLLLIAFSKVIAGLSPLDIAPSRKTHLHGFYCDGSQCSQLDWRSQASRLSIIAMESNIVRATTLPSWQSLPLVENSLELLVTLLPLLEEHLRAICITVNDVTPSRALTAEQGEKYLDLDAILGKDSPVDPLLPNGLRAYLGEGFMNLALDVFQLPAGPRVRDKVSHGEANTSDLEVCDAVCEKVLELGIYCLATGLSEDKKVLMADIEEAVRGYRSRFHPLAVTHGLFVRTQDRLGSLFKRAEQVGVDLDFPSSFVPLETPNTLYRNVPTAQAARTLSRILSDVGSVLDIAETNLNSKSEQLDGDELASLTQFCEIILLGGALRILDLSRKAFDAIKTSEAPETNTKRGFAWCLARIETSAARMKSAMTRNDLYYIRKEAESLDEDLKGSSCGSLWE